MTTLAENAATVRELSEAAAMELIDYGAENADDRHAAICDVVDALLAQAETAEHYKRQMQVAANDALAERDAAEKRVVELVEGHDLERLSAERDAAVRAAEQAQERITELHAALERTNESFLATERAVPAPSADPAYEDLCDALREPWACSPDCLAFQGYGHHQDCVDKREALLARLDGHTDDDALYRLESRIAFAKLHRHAGIELPVDLAEEIIGRLRSVPAGEEAAATAPTNEGSPTPISDSSASAGANPVDDALDILRKLAEERLIYDLIWALYDSGALTYQQAARLARGAVS